MSIKRTSDPLGHEPDHIRIEHEGDGKAEAEAAIQAVQSWNTEARLARLEQVAGMEGTAKRLRDRFAEHEADAPDWLRLQLVEAEARARNRLSEEPLKRDKARQEGTRKRRRGQWPDLDKDIREALLQNLQASAKEIWQSLPDSYSDKCYYTDGDEICTESGRTLSFSGFEKRVSKIRTAIKNSRQ